MIAFPRDGFVVDASIALKWFIPETDSEVARALVPAAGERFEMHAPQHWLAEVANAVWARTRRADADAIDGPRAGAIVAALAESDIRLHPLAPVLTLAFDVARTCDVTMYDALYVATAERLDVPFVTADARLLAKLAGTLWAGRALALRELGSEEG